MNGSDLLHAVSETDEIYLSEAENTAGVAGEFKKQKNKKIKASISVLTCLVIAVAAGVLLKGMNKTPELPTNLAVETSAGCMDEIYEVPHWDTLSETQKYTEFFFNGGTYCIINSTPADEKFFGENLGTATVTGFDFYTDTTHSQEVQVFAVRGISTACVLGVRYESGVCAEFSDLNYAPATLGQLLDDLGLRENLVCGKGSAEYFGEDNRYHSILFNDFADSAVWEMLLADTEAINDPDRSVGSQLVDFAVSVPALGIENLAMWVTDTGNLCTNLLGTLKCFYIGENAVKAFTDWMYANVPHSEHIPSTDPPVTAEEASAEETGLAEAFSVAE